MDIIKLNPVFKDYIWGGTKLKEQFNYKTIFEKTAEAWVLSNHKDGICTTDDNTPLDKLFKNFPVLIKLIDAQDNLSVQVHPDNEYALKNENDFGKTEVWYIIEADKNAEIIYGFKNDISKNEFKESIENNTLLNKLNRVKAKKGDVFFIEAGTVHAIGKGILIAEIQQSSNCTYRVYDYNRTDENGNNRPLHIKKALDVAKTEVPKYPVINLKDTINCEQKIAKCDYFDSSKFIIDKKASFEAIDKFNHILVLNGNGKINDIEITKGDSILVPISFGNYTICGNLEFIITKF